MDTNETTQIFVRPFPTAKEQVVSGLIGIALTGVMIGAAVGTLAIIGKVGEIRAARKAAKNQTETTE